MKLKLFTLGALLSLSLTLLNAATVTFTGGGDGTSWFDAGNWDTGTVPVFSDDVIIDGTSNVVIIGNAAANSVIINDDGKLTINTNGFLLIDQTIDNGDGIRLNNNGILDNKGILNVFRADNEGIAGYDNSHFNNSGSYIFEDASEGIELRDDATGFNSGQIIIVDTYNDGLELNNDSRFTNSSTGTISITDTEGEGLEMDSDTYFKNEGMITISDAESDGICMDDDDVVFENYGTLTIYNSDDADLELDDGLFDNKESGVVNLNGGSNGTDGLYIQSGGTFVNEGIVNSHNSEDDALDLVSSSSALENYNIINLSLPGSADNIIENEGDLYNDVCGVINILSSHEIYNSGDLENEGVIATNFGGSNFNDDNFTNNGTINAPNGFSVAPNALAGVGAIIAGPVPAQSACNIINGAFGCLGATTFDPITETYTQYADNCVPSSPFVTDQLSYSLQQLCGDGMITARVESISPIGFAGITFREAVTDNSKKVQLSVNISQSLTREVRYTTGGIAVPTQIFAIGMKWIRIQRMGNYFRGYFSPNGIHWVMAFTTYLPMDQCVYVGLVSHNYNVNLPTTAVFSNVDISGAAAPLTSEEELELAQEVLEDRAEINASIYPNPTTGVVNVELASAESEVNVAVFNTVGKLIQTIQMDPSYGLNQEINLTGMPAGMYFFHITSENAETRIEKVILK